MTCTAPCQGVEILGQSELPRLAEDWDELLKRSYDNRIFFTSAWHRTWWEHFGRGDVRILTVRDEASLQAILPLHIVDDGDERVLTLLGDFNVSDYMDALAEKQQAHRLLTALWCCALGDLSWDRLELRHIPSSSPLLTALAAAASDEGIEVTIEDDEVCPVAILCSNWEGYLQMLSKKQRHEIRRKLRRAQEGVEWNWRTVRTAEELDEELPTFFRLHEASAHDKARFLTPNMRGFFAAVARTFLRSGNLRLSIFRRAGVDVATTLSFAYRGRYLLYNSGYDPAYAAHSPGVAAVALTMQDAIAERAVAIDFLSGNEPYKYQFGASDTHTSRATARR